jgi:hypothetical protein
LKKKKKPFNRSAHHARVLKQLRAAGHLAPDALGILHPKNKTPLLLTTHIQGIPNENRRQRGFLKEDVNYHSPKGE